MLRVVICFWGGTFAALLVGILIAMLGDIFLDVFFNLCRWSMCDGPVPQWVRLYAGIFVLVTIWPASVVAAFKIYKS